MTTAPSSERKKSILRFFAIYAISIVLLTIVMAAFWGDRNAVTIPAQPSAMEETLRREMQLDSFLHTALADLDARNFSFLNDTKLRASFNLAAINRSNAAFTAMLDSIDRNTEDQGIHTTANLTVKQFKIHMASRDALMNRLGNMAMILDNFRNGASMINQPAIKSQETKELEGIIAQNQQKMKEMENQKQKELEEKEKVILALQRRLNQNESTRQEAQTVQNTSSSLIKEWKQKHATVKDAYEKAISRENELKLAYKAVVDDNRRLISRLNEIRGDKLNRTRQ